MQSLLGPMAAAAAPLPACCQGYFLARIQQGDRTNSGNGQFLATLALSSHPTHGASCEIKPLSSPRTLSLALTMCRKNFQFHCSRRHRRRPQRRRLKSSRRTGRRSAVVFSALSLSSFLCNETTSLDRLEYPVPVFLRGWLLGMELFSCSTVLKSFGNEFHLALLLY